MIPILVAAAVGLAVTLFGTPTAIRAFRVWGWGQRIREDGPHTHFEKVGTPTMGGIVMLVALVAAYVATRFTLAVGPMEGTTPAGLSLLLAAVGFGVIGFVDDYLKVRRRRSLGLSKLQKFLGTALVSLVFGIVVAAFSGETGIDTSLSFVRPTELDLGVLFYAWVFVVLTSSSHAVNLTDGLDGLAAGSSILVFAAYVFIAFWQFRHTCEALAQLPGPDRACYQIDLNAMQDTAIVAAAMMGAAAGFLWWNAAPARIFMGDTGALALGGLYVIETMSVIVQVISFRGFHRRVFRMSPVHHHFELTGWPEFTVIVRFWMLAGICASVGLGLYYADFIARGGLD
ncbi:MAG TPA: phospho-N-acetylmuramoyl-pentapeptide-transferase [Actinomycetota bacterium]